MKRIVFILCCLALAACSRKTTPVDPPEDPDPQVIHNPYALRTVGCVTLHSTPSSEIRYLDFQTGLTYTQVEAAASTDIQTAVDMGLNVENGEYWFRNSRGASRFCPIDMTHAQYEAIDTRVKLNTAIEGVTWDDAHAPKTSVKFKTAPQYFAVKTWTQKEDNQYAIVEVSSLGTNSLTLNYKFGDIAKGPEYIGVQKVTIRNCNFEVNGKPIPFNASAATMLYADMAKYGANVCRIYAASAATVNLLDKLYENGVYLFCGLKAGNYNNLPSDRNWDNADFRQEMIDYNIEVVKALKDHPGILCWSLGNEVETGSNSNVNKGMYIYFRDLAAEIRKVDTNHPVSVAFTEKPSATKMNNILEHLSDLDFISFNTYLSYLEEHKSTAGVPFDQLLVNQKGEYWTKPYLISEFGTTGTWNRSSLAGRINSWGALVQLSSEEAAQDYIRCMDIIKGLKNCIGGVHFWWAYQSHGQVLGWYPTFTKDFHVLPAAEAMESVWRGTAYNPKSPLIESWKTSIQLNGKTLGEELNPILSSGQQCTAKVKASCRSGHPDSSLRYKWFIYRDCKYTKGGADWISNVKWDQCEYVYCPYGQNMSMDEDARAELFVDRTLPEVSFTAPTEKDIYRLYVIAMDDSNNTAATACINFRVQ